MSRAQTLRRFVSERLHAAVDAALEEVLEAFDKTIEKYEQEATLSQEVISRQHALLCALHNPVMQGGNAPAVTEQLRVRKEEPPSYDSSIGLTHNQGSQSVKSEAPARESEPLPSPQLDARESEPQLDATEIIQFTYNSTAAAGPYNNRAGPYNGTAGPEGAHDHTPTPREQTPMPGSGPHREATPGLVPYAAMSGERTDRRYPNPNTNPSQNQAWAMANPNPTPGHAWGPNPNPQPAAVGVQLISSDTEDSADYCKGRKEARPPATYKKRFFKRPGHCRICNRTFQAQRRLIQHATAHLQDRTPGCAVCGEAFLSSRALEVHLQCHERKRGKGKARASPVKEESGRELRPHRDTRMVVPPISCQRMVVPPISCQDCGKTFVLEWNKRKHRCDVKKSGGKKGKA